MDIFSLVRYFSQFLAHFFWRFVFDVIGPMTGAEQTRGILTTATKFNPHHVFPSCDAIEPQQ